ncbi:MAG: ImmA/IrrE family metallo-endopeptidase [Gemmatimonadaceae bacterium]
MADLLGIKTVPNADVRDARTVPTGKSARIEFNPTRPRGRLNYSLAHEIAHTLFPDYADTVRHRATRTEVKGDEWQLEALCNIAAAELLMPFGAMASQKATHTDIDQLVNQQKLFDVSTEALFIRSARLSDLRIAMFCAAHIDDGLRRGRYRLEYLIGSDSWPNDLRGARGDLLPQGTIAARCVGVGFTAKGLESWQLVSQETDAKQFVAECVGIPPYPGARLPRVVGMLRFADSEVAPSEPVLTYVRGDATKPSVGGRRIIVHVVNDATPNWGGGGFASALRSALPSVQSDFQQWVSDDRRHLCLGNVRIADVNSELMVASIVAQHGYKPSVRPKIRYDALRKGLAEVAKLAALTRSTVHMPRIGCGQAGGSWDVIEPLIRASFGPEGVRVTVYDLPSARPHNTQQSEQTALSLN